MFFKGFFGGVLGLSGFYYLLLLAVTQDPWHPIYQFKLFQPWMSLLILGFGVQMGLFWMLKQKKEVKLVAGTGSAVSGTAMVVCCVHHVVDLLPILGFSAAALFLSEYQEELLIFGVLTNLAGIVFMLWLIIKKGQIK
ncbi:MAG: hypothetical protein U0946_05030 [Patescibacteria group bacterium]|nr:hypothetical protein [Patescibacteria group bacterium]